MQRERLPAATPYTSAPDGSASTARGAGNQAPGEWLPTATPYRSAPGSSVLTARGAGIEAAGDSGPTARGAGNRTPSEWLRWSLDRMADLLLGLAGIAVFAVIASMVLGLLWSPFGALICFSVARFRRLDGDGYGRAGFLYSALFLLPWAYLALRIAGASIPNLVARAGYALAYGLWLAAAAALVGYGLFTTGLYLIGNEDARGADAAIMIAAGCFIAALWFVSLRRLLRRSSPSHDAPSVPMRVAYTALHALWPLLALGIFGAGMFEFREFDKLDAAVPLWTCAAAMGLAWLVAMLRFDFKKADMWDQPSRPRPGALPPDAAYIEPYVHLYLLILIPALVGLIVWLFVILLWAGALSPDQYFLPEG